METQGYLIVLKPELVLRNYETSPWVKERMEKYPEARPALRRAFSRFDPKAYRGIAREPLEAYDSLDPKQIEEYRKAGVDMDANREARMRMYELHRDRIERLAYLSNEDEDLLGRIEEATEVYSLLEKPSDYEIIEVRRVEFTRSPSTLGLDIGHWYSDHFSLIADTIVIPTWHVPDAEVYGELASKLAALNENLLFDTPEDAAVFKEYCITKEWAETELEWAYFFIIQVDDVRVDSM